MFLAACMYVYQVCDGYSWEFEKGFGSTGTGVTGSSEPCGCWELNSGPLASSAIALNH